MTTNLSKADLLIVDACALKLETDYPEVAMTLRDILRAKTSPVQDAAWTWGRNGLSVTVRLMVDNLPFAVLYQEPETLYWVCLIGHRKEAFEARMNAVNCIRGAAYLSGITKFHDEHILEALINVDTMTGEPLVRPHTKDVMERVDSAVPLTITYMPPRIVVDRVYEDENGLHLMDVTEVGGRECKHKGVPRRWFKPVQTNGE